MSQKQVGKTSDVMEATLQKDEQAGRRELELQVGGGVHLRDSGVHEYRNHTTAK